MLTTLTGFSQFVINILLPYTNTETRFVIELLDFLHLSLLYSMTTLERETMFIV